MGQLAYISSDKSKLHSRDKYLVVAVEEKDVILQKFTKDQFRGKQYKVKNLTSSYYRPTGDPYLKQEKNSSGERL